MRLALHRDLPATGVGQTLLRDLTRRGPQTASQLARARASSRQQIQEAVDRLLELGLIESVPNPAHRRSPLLVPTAAGSDVVNEVVARETAMLRAQPFEDAGADVAAATDLLRRVRETLE